ncbi:GntR family transcriptional regulator [Alicyclobacillus fodiniaquatilis]|jgi:DNA-binding transcriptional regulator YhcF (GntR family)|uniref:GntR family transcriptional regulator n=1 Tax=Alicyclobacillus fodiniaquatilis TaxID=1661150 RepID=A0ABW4JEH7_9BACL
MKIILELESDTPLYQQIRDQIVEGIATGQLVDGASLPSTRQLAADFGINFHTVNKAYDLLRQEGLLRLNRKSGAVIHVDLPPEVFREQWQARARVLLAEAFVKGIDGNELLEICRTILAGFTASPLEDTK